MRPRRGCSGRSKNVVIGPHLVLVVPELASGHRVHCIDVVERRGEEHHAFTTRGEVSIDSSTAVWNVNTGLSLSTLLVVICAAG